MYRATHLFFETPAERDAAEQEAQAAKDPVSRKLNYPALGEEKKQLNSILYDAESGGQEVISMSCFARPPPRTVPKPISTKASSAIPAEAL